MSEHNPPPGSESHTTLVPPPAAWQTTPQQEHENVLTGGVRYVEVAPHTGWQTMARTVRDIDEDKIKDCKEDIDTLLVFAGLYSAVLSAFLIESYKSLQPDPNVMMMYYLERIAVQTQGYTIVSGVASSSSHPPAPPSQGPVPPWALRVNGLWFASLIVSLATASLSMLVKQWLREYLAVEYTAPQERLRARQFRNPGFEKWKVLEIAAVLPMLLQISLGLFFIGLCFFTANVDQRMGLTSTPLVTGWAFFVAVTTFAPLISPRCPYKMPLLKSVMRALRVHITMRLRRSLSSWFSRQLATGDTRAELPKAKLTSMDTALSAPELKGRKDAKPSSVDYEEEITVVTRDQDDKVILLETDAIMADDNLLSTMWDTFQQRVYDPTESLSFIVQLMLSRIDRDSHSYLEDPTLSRIPNLTSMPRRAWTSFMEMLADLANRRQPEERLDSDLCPSWLRRTTLLLLSESPYPLPRPALICIRNLLRSHAGFTAAESIARWIPPKELGSGLGALLSRLNQLYHQDTHDDLLRALWSILTQRAYDPAQALSFLIEQIIAHVGSKANYLQDDTQCCQSIPDLTSVPQQSWNTLMVLLADLTKGWKLTSDPHSPDWLKKTTLLLLARSRHPLPPSASQGLHRIILESPGLSAIKAIFSWVAQTSGDEEAAFIFLERLRPVYEKEDNADANVLQLIGRISTKKLNILPPTWCAPELGVSKDPSKLFDTLIDYLASLHIHNAQHLRQAKLTEIPDLSGLSRRMWETVTDIIADIAGTRSDPLTKFHPDWLQKATLLLLAHSPHTLPPSAVKALRNILCETERRTQALWIPNWLSIGSSSQHALVYRRLSPSLCPIFEDRGKFKACLYTVYSLYIRILRPHCSRGRSTTSVHSVYRILRAEPTLFNFASTRLILEDLWDVVKSALIAQAHGDGEAITGTGEGLAIIMEFAERMNKTSDAVEVLASLWGHWYSSYLALIYASTALHPLTDSQRDYTIQVGIDAFLRSNDQSKLIDNSIKLASFAAAGKYEVFVPMDMVRFCFLHVSIYARYRKQEKRIENKDHGFDKAPGDSANHPMAAQWTRLWFAIATALRVYDEKKGWTAVYRGTYWRPKEVDSDPKQLFAADRILAKDSVNLIESSWRDEGKSPTAADTLSPSEAEKALLKALASFGAKSEDLSKDQSLQGPRGLPTTRQSTFAERNAPPTSTPELGTSKMAAAQLADRSEGHVVEHSGQQTVPSGQRLPEDRHNGAYEKPEDIAVIESSAETGLVGLPTIPAPASQENI